GGFMAMVALDQATQGGDGDSLRAQVVRVVAASLWMLPAMFLIGLVISLVLRANAAHVHKLYGADLAGGGVGCLLVLPLMNWIGGDDGIFVIGALAAGGAFFLARAARAARTAWLALAGTLLLLALPFGNRAHALVDVRSRFTGLSDVKNW